MAISQQTVEKLSQLAKLRFSEEEKTRLALELEKVLGYMDKLKKLELEEVEPMMAVDNHLRPLRADTVQPSLPKEKVFANAPELEHEHFAIPRVLGG